jgi:Mrp family chromosome partitioning ATPase/capsular polysaccharide biosynthesis protein
LEHHSRHESSSLSAYLRVLRRRKWVVIVCALLVPAAAYFFSARQEAIYQSSAQVFINKQDIGSAITGIENQTLFVDEDRAAETQVNLASVPDVAARALAIANVTGMTPDDLLAESSVDSVGLSDVIEFTVTDPDPLLAQRLAGAYAQAFTEYRGELDTAAVRTARREVDKKLGQLEAEGKKGTALYDNLTESEQQLATLETLKTSRAKVVREADEATQVAPTPMRNAVLGLALGLVLGVGLAFAIDALDTRVRSANEIGERLGLPLLARIPPPPKGFAKEDRLVMLAQPTGTNAEAFRMLRANLDFSRLEGNDVRVILVTSAVEQEGKSTTAANLALAEARAGRRVALVDLDLRRPYLDRFFGLLHAHGVTDVALGNAELGEALHHVDLATGQASTNGRAAQAGGNGAAERGSLDVLTAGPLPPDPGEFVGTRRLAEILARLRAAYDLVIIDSPPLLRVGDAMTLSSQADGLLVVTRLNVVRRPMLGELKRQLDTAPVPKLGYVVTGSSGDAKGYGYGYGYPYGGYGYGDPEKTANERAQAAAQQGAAAAERAIAAEGAERS